MYGTLMGFLKATASAVFNSWAAADMKKIILLTCLDIPFFW